jgi:hypothetical protein
MCNHQRPSHDYAQLTIHEYYEVISCGKLVDCSSESSVTEKYYFLVNGTELAVIFPVNILENLPNIHIHQSSCDEVKLCKGVTALKA